MRARVGVGVRGEGGGEGEGKGGVGVRVRVRVGVRVGRACVPEPYEVSCIEAAPLCDAPSSSARITFARPKSPSLT